MPKTSLTSIAGISCGAGKEHASVRRRLLSEVFSAPSRRAGLGLPVALALLMAVAGMPASAQTWTGAADGSNWFTGGNWQGGVVPSATHPEAVIIDNGADVAVKGAAASMASLTLGVNKPGNRVTISNGGTLAVYENSFIGKNKGSSGTVIVTGKDSSFSRGDYYSGLTIGHDGTGELTVAGGAESVWSNLIVGANAGSQGKVTVSGKDSFLQGSLQIGAAGDGSLLIENGGSVSSGSTIWVGSGGGTGDITVRGSGSTLNGGVQLGAGTLTVSGGAMLSSGNAIGIVGRANGAALATFSGAGTAVSAPTISVSGSFDDGARLVIRNGAKAHADGGVILSGDGSGGAEILVTGAGSVLSTDGTALFRGTADTVLTLTDGGSLIASNMLLGIPEQGAVVNIGAAAGKAAATAGILDVSGEISFLGADASVVFNHTNEGYDFGGALVGAADSGTIRHIAGQTRFSGDSSEYLSNTEVTGGALYVTGALGGQIDVSGGMLGGAGTIGSAATEDAAASRVTIASGGKLAPGLAGQVGTLTVAGDLLFESGSVYEVRVAGDKTSDLTTAGGDVTIENGAKLAVLSLGKQADYGADYSGSGHTYTVLTADGALSGAFDLTTTETAFLTYSTHADGKNAYVNVVLKGEVPTDPPTDAPTDPPTDPPTDAPTDPPTDPPTDAPTEPPTEAPTEPPQEGVFEPVAKTENQIAAAQALDSLPMSNPLWFAVANAANDEAARLAFDQLSGGTHASAQSALMGETGQIRNLANDRLRFAMDDGAAPTSGLRTVASTKGDADFTRSEPQSVWVQAYGARGEIEGTAGDLDTRSHGLIMGVDTSFEDWRIGVMGGIGRSSSDTSSAKNDTDSYHVGLYAGTQWGALSLRTGLSYSKYKVSSSRQVLLLGETLSADYDANAVQAFGELGYRIDAGNAAVEPYANLAHVRLKTDAFTETGGTAALSVSGNKMDTTYTTLGVRLSSSFDFGASQATLHGDLGWRHAFGDVVPQSTHAFLTGGDAFTVSGVPLSKNTGVISAGVDFNLSSATTLRVSYVGQHSSNMHENGVSARFDMKF